MNRDKLGKYIFSAVFLTGCFTFMCLSLNKTYSGVNRFLRENNVKDASNAKENMTKLNNVINESIVGKYNFIETYGSINKFLGKKEINGFEYVIDKDGHLNSGNFWSNIRTINSEPLAVRVKKLADKMDESGTKVAVLGFPEKYRDDNSKNYYGIPYNSNKYVMDDYFGYIRRYSIPYIDFRETINKSNLSYDETFFKTDYQWKSRAAFEGFVEFVDLLNKKFDYKLDEENYYRNLNNYNIEKYEGMMLGYGGRAAGIKYAPAEDFELIYPKKDNNEYVLYQKDNGKEWTYEGNNKESLIAYDLLDDVKKNKNGIYSNSLFDMYLHGSKSETKIINKTKDEGLKVLFLTDSYANPLVEFMAPLCKEIDIICASKYNGNIEDYMKENNYDLIVIGFYPNDIKEEFFDFCKDED